MTKGRDKVAESLNDILQMISSRKRSGLLSIERYNAGHFEEGEIYFEKGRPVQAFFEMLSGQEALSTLSSWRNIYYSFMVDVPVPANPYVPPGGISGGTDPYSTSEPLVKQRYTTGSVRQTNEPPTGPVRQTNEPPSVSPLRRSSQLQPPSGPQPPYPQQQGGVARERITGGYGKTSDVGNVRGFEGLVPHRLSNQQDVLALPLTRPQRSIYLLVDGTRTVADLVRCTAKSMQDVERLLMELKQMNLIGL